jgi:fumarate hydratase, class II
VFVPVIARNLLESIDLLASVGVVFADKCIKGIEANSATLQRYAEASPAIGAALNPHLGYDTTAAIIKESNRTGKSIREVVRARKLMTDVELDRALDVEAMTRGGIIE